MSKVKRLYALEIGYYNPTIIYEVKLKKIKSLNHYTLDKIKDELDDLGADHIMIDKGYPKEIKFFKKWFIQIIEGKFNYDKD